MQVIQGLVLFNVFLALCFNSVNAMKRTDVGNSAQTKMVRNVTTTNGDEKDVENSAQTKMVGNVTTTNADEKDVENSAQTKMVRNVTTTNADEKDRILYDRTEANSIKKILWVLRKPAMLVHNKRKTELHLKIRAGYLSRTLIQQLLKSDEVEEVETPIVLKKNPNAITGRYSFAFLPLDGTFCSKSTVPVGTAFSIYRKVSTEDLAKKEIVAAGYLLYEDTIKLVLAYNNNVHYLIFTPRLYWFKYEKTFTGFPLAIKDEEHDYITHPISYFHNILNGEAQSFFLPRREDKNPDIDETYLHKPIRFIADNFKKSLRRIPDIF